MISSWLGKHVEIYYAPSPNAPFDSGRVVAYTDQPQILVETKRGEQIWWHASLARTVGCNCECHREIP